MDAETQKEIIEWCVYLCSRCGKKIKGRNWNHALSNLNEHKRTHEKEGVNEDGNAGTIKQADS